MNIWNEKRQIGTITFPQQWYVWLWQVQRRFVFFFLFFFTSTVISFPLTAHSQWIACLCDLPCLVIQCTLFPLQTFSESGPQCPYWHTLTKAPLFHVYISYSGREMQEIQLPLMRKGLHTPLVVLSTWNPGHSVAETPRNNLSGKFSAEQEKKMRLEKKRACQSVFSTAWQMICCCSAFGAFRE